MTDPQPRNETAIAFLGYVASAERVLADPSLSLADNRMQRGYITALREQYADVHVISSVPASLTQGPGTVETLDDGVPVTHLGARSRRIVRAVAAPLGLGRELDRWARARPGRPLVLVHYNTFLLYLAVGTWLRARHGARLVPIAITLPYDTPDQPRTVSGRVQERLTRRLLRRVDGLIAITPYLGDRIAPKSPTLVVRGGIDGAQVSAAPGSADPVSADPVSVAPVSAAPVNVHSRSPRRVVYAGNLSARYNLDVAVAAMSRLPAGEYELHLYGRGSQADALRRSAREAPGIFVHEPVAEDDVAELLAAADVLLVLLATDDQLALHSFPSKIFESLASGTPVISTDLATLDPEMREHLTIMGSLDPDELADTIESLCGRSPDDRSAARTATLRYVREHVTWSAVGEEIRGFLEGPRSKSDD